MGFAVSTKFTGRDLISKTFARMGKNADRFGNKSSKAFKKANRSASRFRDITKGILAAAGISKVLGGLRQGLSAVTTEFIGFDGAIISAAAKFKDVNLATAEGQKRLLELKKAARETGAATQFSAGQAASGLDFLAMAGFNATQAMAALPGVVNLATVANVDLSRATDIASDSLGAFGLMTEDTTQLQKNFTRVNDVMALTMSRTNTNMEDMFEAVKKGAPDFTKAGQSLESFNALLGVMANSGKKGSEAGTALRNIMLRLASPTKEAQKAINAIGIKTADASGNFRDIVDILADVEKGTKKMGEVQKTAALSTIFGARAVGSINILLTEGSGKIRSFRDELLNAGGASQKMADIMRTSLGNRLKSMSSAAIEFGFKIFTAFEKRGAGAIDKMTEAIRNFDPQFLIDGLNLAIKSVTSLFNIIKFFGPELLVITGGFLAYGVVMKGLAIGEAVIGFIKLFSVLKSTAAVMGILNAVMIANPIGAIIFGVTALVAAIVLLEKKFKVFTKIGQALGKFFIPGFGKNEETAAGVGAAPVAPNKEEAAAQRIAFKGQLDISGAPAGSTVQGATTGAPAIDMNLLGVNP
jgi:TP901 family phage tail tape measure protein